MQPPLHRTWGRKQTVQAVCAAIIVLLAFFLCFYNVGNNGFGNLYYSAAVKSMTTSWHNFFFLSFDPAGFVSVDKPPAALWIEAAFVKAFGFHSWTLLLPEALETAASVFLLYHLVKKSFGFAAGLISSLLLTVTPILIAAAHSNNPDALLVLVLLLAAWSISRAAATARARYLILTAVWIGIGFNTKMLVAFLVLPACALVWLFTRGLKWRHKLLHMAAACVVLAVVSACWVGAVDLTPAAQRPYVGSSANDTERDLAFGYNGLSRVISSKKPAALSVKEDRTHSAPIPSAHHGAAHKSETHTASLSFDKPGAFRMFDLYVGEQVSWFLPLAAVGTAAAILYICGLEREQRRGKISALLLWGGWTAVMAVFFSFYPNLTHRYYLNILAPGFAALGGIGFSCMVKLTMQKEHWWKSLFLPAGLILSAVFHLCLIVQYPSWFDVLWPFDAVCIVLAAVLPVLTRFQSKRRKPRVLCGLACAALACLLIAPFLWSFTTVIGSVSGSDASAGPKLLRTQEGLEFPSVSSVVRHLKNKTADPKPTSFDLKLSTYLEQHQDGAEYLAATPTAVLGQSLLIDTGRPVMAIGGYNGSNPILTLPTFVSMVAQGKVRYFYTSFTTPVLTDKEWEPADGFGLYIWHRVKLGVHSESETKNPFGVRGHNTNTEIYDWAVDTGTLVPSRTYLGKTGSYHITLYQLSQSKAAAEEG